MSAHVLLILLNKLRKSNEMGGSQSILSLFTRLINPIILNQKFLSYDIKAFLVMYATLL